MCDVSFRENNVTLWISLKIQMLSTAGNKVTLKDEYTIVELNEEISFFASRQRHI